MFYNDEGAWYYCDKEFEGPLIFSRSIDIDLLEDAARSIDTLPAAFSIGGGGMNFTKLCSMLAARRCYNSGQTVAQIAKSAGKSEATIRRWLTVCR